MKEPHSESASSESRCKGGVWRRRRGEKQRDSLPPGQVTSPSTLLRALSLSEGSPPNKESVSPRPLRLCVENPILGKSD
jgi:hypothetical protein